MHESRKTEPVLLLHIVLVVRCTSTTGKAERTVEKPRMHESPTLLQASLHQLQRLAKLLPGDHVLHLCDRVGLLLERCCPRKHLW